MKASRSRSLARKILFRALAGFVVAALLLLVASWLALRLSLPVTQGEGTLAGLENPVTIRFDEWRRPYVQAQTLGDALQAEGWLHAQNRLWQMELLRRAGQGRLAELLGAGLLEADRELWRIGVPQLARALEVNADSATLDVIDSYLAGVNAGIGRYAALPPEFLLLGAKPAPWTRGDVFALGALMAFQSANNRQNELLRLALVQILDREAFSVFLTDDSGQEDYPFVLPIRGVTDALDRTASTEPTLNALMPRFGFGSNGWVVSPDKSVSGKALFAFDSHDDLGLPNLFYEVHLFFGEGRQLRGWSVPGLPGVINGYNEAIAWGFTNIGDTQDLFVETRSEQDPMRFRDGDDWYRARGEEITIPVAGGEPESLTIIHTRNGPLISEDPPLSLAWTVHRMDRPSLDSLLPLNLARNWREFNAALDTFPAPTLNATYADIDGVIGFRTAGVIPVRGCGQGLLPQDGSDPGCRWRGLVPAADMPRRSNPGPGFLAAANARVNAAGDGPLVSADNAAPYRIRRIGQVLSGEESLGRDDMQALQMDWTDGQAQMLLPALLEGMDRQRLNPLAAELATLLERWAQNPVAQRDSAAALVFQHWYLDIARRLFADRLEELYPRLLRRSYLLNHALDHLVLHAPEASWWRGDRSGILSAALNDTARSLRDELGPRPEGWRLDDLQQVSLKHELGRAVPLLGFLFNHADEPWGGGPATVGRARYGYAAPFRVNSGATVRVVAEMSHTPRVSAVIPGGQSGHPLSPNYADQFPGWLEGELHPVATAPEEATAGALVLNPIPIPEPKTEHNR